MSEIEFGNPIHVDYGKKYKEALERAREALNDGTISSNAIAYLQDIFPELKESEEEMVRKDCIKYLDWEYQHCPIDEDKMKIEKCITWLEKQGNTNETINSDEFAQGVLKGAAINLITWVDYNAAEGNMCLSNMECKDIVDALVSGDWNKIYAYMKKKLEKQGEQKLAAKFKVGDWCIDNEDGVIFQIVKVLDNTYIYKTNEGKEYSCTHYSLEQDTRPWAIQDAKEGDVLVYNNSSVEIILLFKKWLHGVGDGAYSYAHTFNNEILFNNWSDCGYATHPATKEQRDFLFQKMKEASYEFDFEKKELKKIEEEEYDDENYGIDGLWHAKDILEKTLGKVDGYQSDDGILEHKCAITAVKKLYEKKSAKWSEEDECYMGECISAIATKDGWSFEEKRKTKHWLKQIKQRIEGESTETA